jgi:hypothetical protein
LRVNILDNFDNNAIDIEVLFTINNVTEPVTVTTTISRVR